MIVLEDEHYKGHTKAHPKDAEFLNKPINNYQRMEIIFGCGIATGKYAMGSNEPLGLPSDFNDSSQRSDHFCNSSKTPKFGDEKEKQGDDPTIGKDAGSVSGASRKRKRAIFNEEDSIIFSNMTAAVHDVTAAIRETKPQEVHHDLYGAVMFTPGFHVEALIAAFTHLVSSKAEGYAFVAMNDAHCALWLRTYLAKHYGMG